MYSKEETDPDVYHAHIAAFGHCHIIGNIYEKYLDRWFERALKGEDLALMRRVFDDLTKADMGLKSRADEALITN